MNKNSRKMKRRNTKTPKKRTVNAKIRITKKRGGTITKQASPSGAAPLNCSPFVSGKTVNTSTCYTPEILIQIKDAYNKSHSPKEYIPWSNPNEIWNTLKSRLVNCEKEDCWLATLKDSALSTHIKEVIFAPEHPPEWIKNPNEWLTDVDILNVMKQYQTTYSQFKFIGPSPIDFDTKVKRDELPWAKKGPSDDNVCVWEELCHLSLKKLIAAGKTQLGMIFNLDRYDEPGSHWVSLYLSLGEHSPIVKIGGNGNMNIAWPKVNDSSGGKKQKPRTHRPTPFIFYFDSTGASAPKEIKTLIERIQLQGKQLSSPINIISYNNNGQDHQKSNTECGMYSLFFIITMLTGKLNENGTEKTLDFNGKIKLFRDAIIPDKYVEMYRHKYFNTPK